MIKNFVKKALQEDVGRGDLFRLVGKNRKVTAKIVSKEDGILSGVDYVKSLCKVEKIKYEFFKKDSMALKKGDIIASFESKANKILMCERTMLNLLQHASGIATNVHSYMDQLYDIEVKLLDTRKTRPLLRVFEKYAVRCGGGSNHRMGLDDCLMLKDTHLKTINNLKNFVKDAKYKLPYTTKIEIECESTETAKYAMQCHCDMVMCDNMSIEEIKEVVKYKNENFPYILLEASGNITKENILEFAKSGVDAISSGSLIHQATWLDFSMKIE
jgi:nicotinate-nucleotide pyrophosphorylase (carboxylating)